MTAPVSPSLLAPVVNGLVEDYLNQLGKGQPGTYDAMLDGQGQLRPGWQSLLGCLEALGPTGRLHQPEEIQRWIYKNPDNVALASRAIDLYKMENNIAIQKSSRQSQLSRSNAADMVSTKTTGVEPQQTKIWTQREIASLSMDDYDRYEKEIDLAIQEGRVAR